MLLGFTAKETETQVKKQTTVIPIGRGRNMNTVNDSYLKLGSQAKRWLWAFDSKLY